MVRLPVACVARPLRIHDGATPAMAARAHPRAAGVISRPRYRGAVVMVVVMPPMVLVLAHGNVFLVVIVLALRLTGAETHLGRTWREMVIRDLPYYLHGRKSIFKL